MWKHLRHQNIVPFIGVTQNPLQFVSEWMPNGTLTKYISENPNVDRIGLVGLSSPVATWSIILSPLVVRCGRRSGLPPCETHDARRLERSKYPLGWWATLNSVDPSISTTFSSPPVAMPVCQVSASPQFSVGCILLL